MITDKWLFSVSPKYAVYTTEFVLTRLQPIIHIARSNDDTWQFLSEEGADESSIKIVQLKTVWSDTHTLSSLQIYNLVGRHGGLIRQHLGTAEKTLMNLLQIKDASASPARRCAPRLRAVASREEAPPAPAARECAAD